MINYKKSLTKILLLVTVLSLPSLLFLDPQEESQASEKSIFRNIQPKQLERYFTKQEESLNLEEINTNLSSAFLPIAEIKLDLVEGSEKTVFFLPQNHRYPGSKISDPKNDSAEIAQKELFKINKFLHNDLGVELIVTEGEFEGQVPKEKVLELQNKIATKDQFEKNVTKLENALGTDHLDEQKEKSFFQKSQNLIAILEREIRLKGAPFMLKAESNKVILLGAENKETHALCTEIVRDYIYQKDRLAQCQANQTALSAPSQSSDLLAKVSRYKKMIEQKNSEDRLFLASDTLEIKKLLEKKGLLSKMSVLSTNNETDFAKLLNDLKSLAEKKDQAMIVSLLEEIEKNYDNIKNKNNNKTFSQSNGSNKLDTYLDKTKLTSRSDNPYAHINDPEEIQLLIEESEEKIQSTVIERRNRETAEIFLASLENNNQNVGILQYGAGHEKGLIEELNKQGINVVTIKSNEVKSREK